MFKVAHIDNNKGSKVIDSMTVTFKWDDIEFMVSGTYIPADPGDAQCPPQAANFEVEKINMKPIGYKHFMSTDVSWWSEEQFQRIHCDAVERALEAA